ncbi:MAG: folate family ECF transporter S component [Eubacteriales bacterium]
MNKKVYKVVAAGLLIALSIVLTRVFSTYLMIAGIPGARLAIGFVPIILASIALGPYFGMVTGALADVLGYVIFPSGAYFPPITITSMLVGIIPFLIVKVIKTKKVWAKVLVAVATTQILCSMFLQTLWIALLYDLSYGDLFFPRAVVTLITIPVYSLLIYYISIALKKANLMPDQNL